MNLHTPHYNEANGPSGLVQQDYRPEMGWDAELGGRLCFNAESDCGAGELLVRLLGEDADRDDDWVSSFEAAAKNKKRHTTRS